MNIQSKIRLILILLFLGIIISTFLFYNYSTNIEKHFPVNIEESTSISKEEAKRIVYFGVISRYSPNIIYKGYQPLMDYLTENTNYRFELKLSNDYKETVTQLVNGDVSAAFLGSFIYLNDREKFGLTAILKPLNDSGEPYFQSALITKMEYSIHSINDLKGKKLALPSKQSFSGNWLPLYEMNKFDIKIEELDSVHHFSHHHTVVHQILMGNFDAGVVKDRVAKEFLNEGIQIFALSDPIPGSPIVIPKNYDPEVIHSIKKTLLKVDVKSPHFKRIMRDWDKEFSNGFVEANDSDYDEMEETLQRRSMER